MHTPNNKHAPTRYGIISFLYSAFSSILPIIYFIPSIAGIKTDTIIPTFVIAVNIILVLSTNCDVPPIVFDGLYAFTFPSTSVKFPLGVTLELWLELELEPELELDLYHELELDLDLELQLDLELDLDLDQQRETSRFAQSTGGPEAGPCISPSLCDHCKDIPS